MSDNNQFLILKDQDEAEGKDFYPLDYVFPIIKNRWEILLIVLVGLLLAIVYNFLATPIYSAQSSVIIRRAVSPNVIKERRTEIADKVGKYDFNSKIMMIKSQAVLMELVERLMDMGHYENRLKQVGFEKMDEVERTKFIAGRANRLRGIIEAKNVGESNMVTITCSSANPVFARDVANQLADLVVEYDSKEQAIIMQKSLGHLKKQMEEAREQVEVAEKKLYDYRQEHDIFVTSMDRKLTATQRAQQVEKLADIRRTRSQLESKIEEIKKLKKQKDYTKYTPVENEAGLLMHLHKQLVDAEVRYERLKKNYLGKHPELITERENIEVLKEKFNQEFEIILSNLNYNLNVVKAQEKTLEKTLERMERSAVASTLKDIDYLILERDADSNSALYNVLLDAVKEVNVNASNMNNTVVYVHEKGSIPLAPSSPNKSKNIMFGLFMGGVIGIAFAFGREHLDMTIRHPDDIKKAANLPVLSTVPMYAYIKEDEVPLIVSYKPKSLFSEGVTTLRTQLKVKLSHERPMALAVTSSSPKEGKTLIACNLAGSMAMEGKKTIIVDADLHRPNVHKTFGGERDDGLFDIVADGLNPDWPDMDTDLMSIGDALHMIHLKHWSGTMKVQWDSLSVPLSVSYNTGVPMSSNIHEWREKFSTPEGFPAPRNWQLSMDDSEIADFPGPQDSGAQAVDFLRNYPVMCKSQFFKKLILNHYVRKTELKNLHFISAGSSFHNTSDVLGSEQMKTLLQILRENYDRIIIDTPPAWPLSDVGVLSSIIDGVVWIVRQGDTPRNVFKNSVQQIQQVQPNILGVVINAIDIQRGRYYYYGYSLYPYYHYYKYHYYYKDYLGGEDRDRTL